MQVSCINKDNLNIDINCLDRVKRNLLFCRKPLFPKLPLKKFSLFAFLFGLFAFVFGLLFQFWVQTSENPQMLSGKPNFNLSIALPFAFEIAMLIVGILIFLRFLLVNLYFNRQVPNDVKKFINNMDENSVLIVSLNDTDNEK
ncbi:MAG: hypothetical protein CH6_2035 [Candidatus Kapaibacterium sp.]|nr:MAG: hypothetical protein CH6_2035 [Candidatus Kapabacteria bacterium]